MFASNLLQLSKHGKVSINRKLANLYLEAEKNFSIRTLSYFILNQNI